jgi:hypothetical protein
MAELRIETIELPGVRIEGENPLPFFRDKQVNLQIPLHDSVDEEKRRFFGNASG